MNIETSPDFNQPIASSGFASAREALFDGDDLAEAVSNLIAFWVTQGLAFTSGHVVHAIREARTDLLFRQATVGQMIREAFEGGEMPSYDDGGDGAIRPVRMLRTTTLDPATGATRTPMGTDVFVYGPDSVDISMLEFEVNIATAPEIEDDQGNKVAASTALLDSPRTNPQVQVSGKVACTQDKLVATIPDATIHRDGRLCVPRAALEALAYETGEQIMGGEPLHVKHDEDLEAVFIYTTPQPGTLPLAPTKDRLRLHVRLDESRPVGQNCPIEIEGDRIVIHI